jgi:hypothetical protein
LRACISTRHWSAASAHGDQLGCQPHDLFVEGVDLMMRKYGPPSAADRRQEMAGLGKNRPTKRIVTP